MSHILPIQEVKYYSFKTGYFSQGMQDWILHDIKIPALDLKQATLIFFFHLHYQNLVQNKWVKRKKEFQFPSPEFVFMNLRQAIEYSVAKKRGTFLVQYKKQRIISAHEILESYK